MGTSDTPSKVGDAAENATMGRPGPVRRRSSLQAGANTERNFLASFHKAQQAAVPLSKAGSWDAFLGFFSCDSDGKTLTKVSVTKLLSFSTPKERWLMALGVVLATFSGLGIPAWLALLAHSLDTFTSLAKLIEEIGGDELFAFLRQELNKMCIGFAIVGGISLVSGSLYVSIWTYLGEKQALRIQKAFVRSAINQDAAWFDENDREALPTNMSTSLVHVNAAIGRQIVDVYSLFISSLGCLLVALLLNTALSFIMLCVIPLVALVMFIINWFVRKRNRESAVELALAGSIATEVIAGIKTVFALCSQNFFVQQYNDHLARSERRQIRSVFLSSFLGGLIGFMFYVTYTFAFYIGTEQVISGADFSLIVRCFLSGEPQCRVTGASVMCSIYGVILCVTFVGLATPGLATINRGRNAAATIFAAIDRVPPIDPNSEDGAKLEQVEGNLEFRSIHFSYPSRQTMPVLFNFNLTVQAGQSVALVGPSGSGKSTIARLLLRFYDAAAGNVLVDGYPLSHLNIAWWRSKVGYVEQEPRLFPGTIRENIALGMPDGKEASEDEIIEAAKAACAHDFIMDLPEKYDTFYSGAAIQLSGGQMQRICIARAIVRKPICLVLDEATSALDSTSERVVQEAIANVRKMHKMTTISIAHRLSTIVDSDQIAVLSNGAVTELGDHKTLMERDGIYKLLCESQGITKDFSNVVEEGTDQGGETHKESTGPKAEQATVDSTVKEEETEMVAVEAAPMSKIWLEVGWDWVYTLLGCIGSLVVGALSPCEAILTANIVNNFYTVAPEDMLEANRQWINLFLAFAIASLVGNILIGIGFARSETRLAGKMRRKAFASILRRGIGWFDEPENTTGELTTLLAADAEGVAALMGLPLGNKVRVLSSITAGIAIAFKFSFQIGLTAIACLPLMVVAGLLQTLCTGQKYKPESEGELSPPTILEQGLRGITSVQAYNLQDKVGDDYATALEPEKAGKVREGIASGLVFGFSQCMVFSSFALVFYVGTDLLVEVEINFLEFFTALLAVMFGAIGASQVSADFRERQLGRAAAARLFSVIEEDSVEDGNHIPEPENGGSVEGGLEFKECEFAYPTRPDHAVFYKAPSNENEALTLSVLPKTALGLVGRSGCGKSTVLQLVLKFYNCTGGNMSLSDNGEFKDLNVNWLRRQIGYVGQQPTLFHGTIRENILLGKPDATEEELVTAAKAAHVHDFVTHELAKGYDTDIGAGGGQLSGGQKQRIAIARAIIQNPKILVLDEATAALDNESEKIVQAALDELQRTQPRTTLVVAHRLQTVKGCDKIAYLGAGGVQEIGGHDDLLAQEGAYHKLWKMQGAEEALKVEVQS
mmetsp:Transcript_84198/g.126234  ORF Transcript_84198/g.126234 Transcript_84198/m.126234 type:complete len:1341 (+) Transcript_84198:186-4208(+)